MAVLNISIERSCIPERAMIHGLLALYLEPRSCLGSSLAKLKRRERFTGYGRLSHFAKDVVATSVKVPDILSLISQ